MGDSVKNYIEYREEELEKLGTFGYDIYIIDNFLVVNSESTETLIVIYFSYNVLYKHLPYI